MQTKKRQEEWGKFLDELLDDLIHGRVHMVDPFPNDSDQDDPPLRKKKHDKSETKGEYKK